MLTSRIHTYKASDTLQTIRTSYLKQFTKFIILSHQFTQCIQDKFTAIFSVKFSYIVT